ncbi:TPA_asm: hypothetical protein G0J71_24990 [Salmonella enterica subsp. enterica serovar Typhimurium]|uniref:Uncharacterized protein n=1 Tax=Salmonella typhimurium TaxID=90371 RepID=A0A706J4W3_SALTM|nr:hypothetical protein [Salmonella enterica subsp. enterica serovar Typhimurium]
MAIFNYTDAGRFYYVGSQIITNKLTGTVYYISLVEKVVIAYKGKSKKPFGVVCGRGRNPTLRLWPAIFSGEIDVFPSERRNMGQEIGR